MSKAATETERFSKAVANAGIDPDDLNSLLDLEAESWGTAESPPPEGAKLVGWIVSVEQREDGPFGAYPIATILSEDGKLVKLHAFHTVLSGRVAAANAGDRIGVKYKGRKASSTPGQSDYYDYAVIVQRRGPVAAHQLASGELPALPSELAN